MIQDIKDKKFNNEFSNAKPVSEDVVFIFRGQNKREDKLLVNTEDDDLIYPTVGELRDNNIINGDERLQFLFSMGGDKFFLLMDFDDPDISFGGYDYKKLNVLRGWTPKDLAFAGMTAYHLYIWYRSNQFCGKCGKPMTVHDKERAMVCRSCGNMVFPIIAPAVIIGLRDGDRILISRYAGREYKGRALLAGFCEIGETAEETVIREVMEEVGLKAKNVEYYKSQPWGMDMNLLLGYFADVDGSTEVTMDTKELAKVAWKSRSEIEYDEDPMSLTADMMQVFRRGEK